MDVEGTALVVPGMLVSEDGATVAQAVHCESPIVPML